MDMEAGRESRDWVGRLSEIEVRITTESGLQSTDVLHLDGLNHLVGLPGSGKTTLIILLCILLARSGTARCGVLDGHSGRSRLPRNTHVLWRRCGTPLG